MIAWFALSGAIVVEVAATLCLRLASDGRRRWWLPVVLGYGTAFALLSVALGAGMNLGVAYGIWVAAGVTLTATLGNILFHEPFTWPMRFGVIIIAGGVVLIEIGSLS